MVSFITKDSPPIKPFHDKNEIIEFNENSEISFTCELPDAPASSRRFFAFDAALAVPAFGAYLNDKSNQKLAMPIARRTKHFTNFYIELKTRNALLDNGVSNSYNRNHLRLHVER